MQTHRFKPTQNKIIVLNGPSGSGKSTLFRAVTAMDRYKGYFGFSVSHTTRAPRPGERDGTDYHFVSHDQFQALKEQGGFLEAVENFGNCYGTSFAAINDVLERKHCILDIDYRGAMALKDVLEREKNVKALFAFISPPSVELLEQRLRGRQTESEDQITKRIDTALRELDFFTANKGFYDVHIVNDNLEDAVQSLDLSLRRFLSGK